MTVPDLYTDKGPNGQRLCGVKTCKGTPCRAGAGLRSTEGAGCTGQVAMGTGSATYKHGLYSKDVFTQLGAIEREAPFFITLDADDAPLVDALRKKYRGEIKRDRASGRVLFGVDFRP